jgi:hypothetical protein
MASIGGINHPITDALQGCRQVRFILRDLFGRCTVFLFQILGATECVSPVVTYGALWKIAPGAAVMVHSEFSSLQAGRERRAMLNGWAVYFRPF